jgi:hypothetical protein
MKENHIPIIQIDSEDITTWFYMNKTRDTADIYYSGQCMYRYPINIESDTINVFYDTIEDCIHYTGVKNDFNLPKGVYPEIGDAFIKLTLDSIRTNNTYLFPRWVDSVNSKRSAVFTKQFVAPNL